MLKLFRAVLPKPSRSTGYLYHPVAQLIFLTKQLKRHLFTSIM